MALKFGDLVFENASCCGAHAVARHVDGAGSEWYFRRSPDDVYSVMKMTNGRLDGVLQSNLTRQCVETMLQNIVYS